MTTLDPATLAAVRERIAGMIIRNPSGVWDSAWNASLEALEAWMSKPKPAEPDPPLTAAEVRRIAREEADRAVAQAREAEKIETEERRKMSLWPHNAPRVNAPPSPPPAKRIEAWVPINGDAAGLPTGRRTTEWRGDWLYLTTHHGVTDAASAEALARNFAWLMNGLELLTHASKEELRACGLPANILDRVHSLAPFVPPDAPR